MLVLLPTLGLPSPQSDDDKPATAKLFEEVKAMVRELPERVDDRIRSFARRGSLKTMKRVHPMMLEELLFHPGFRETRNGPALGWLVFISTFKEDLPWLYEMGLELYRALRDKNEKSVDIAVHDIQSMINAVTRGPMFYEILGPENEEFHFLIRHLPDMTRQFVKQARRTRPRLPPGALNAAAEGDSI